MTKAYITEYRELMLDANGRMMAVPEEPAVAEQVVTFTTATQSNAFNESTRFIRVHVDGICSRKVGSNPTADTNSARMTAGQTEYLGVKGGHKISLINNT